MAATSLCTTGFKGSREVMGAPAWSCGRWPAESDADVEDDAGSDEAESGGGEPLVGGGPCPADAAGVGGPGAVEPERDQSGEGKGEDATGCWGEPCRGPAFEQHGHDERGADDAPAGGADGVWLPVRQVAEDQVGQGAQADDERVAREQALRAPADRVDGPAAQVTGAAGSSLRQQRRLPAGPLGCGLASGVRGEDERRGRPARAAQHAVRRRQRR